MASVVIGLGSNLGSREAFVRLAARMLGASEGIELEKISRAYLTPPVGPPQPEYVNAAVRVRTSLAPMELLARTSEIERTLGRTRTVRWGPRTIDLDILWWEDREVNEPGLRIPHAGLRERAFALAPLLDVAPELAAELGPILAQLGTPEARDFSRAVRAAGDRIEIEALDDADALALALDAALGEGTGASEPIDAADPAELVRRTAGAASVVVERLDFGGLAARLIHDPARESAPNVWDLLDLRGGRCVLFQRSGPKLL